MSLETLCILQEQLEEIMKVNIDLIEKNKTQEEKINILENKIKKNQEYIKSFDIETKIDTTSLENLMIKIRQKIPA